MPVSRYLRLMIAVLALASGLRAAELVGTIELKSGKTLHNAKVLSDQWDSIVVFATEGMVKVKKADLPEALLAKYPMKAEPPPPMVMMKTMATAQAPAHGEVAPPMAPKPAPAAPDNNGLYLNMLILSSQLKPMQASQGCVEVTVHNNGSEAQTLKADRITCVDQAGGIHVGKRFFIVADQGTMVKNEVSVPGGGDVTEIVYFQNEELRIGEIRWAH